MRKDITVLVCCHKKDFFYSGDGYFPIQVGKELANVDLGIQGDNSGENISKKNPNFCELTAHYWLWKNGTDSKYVGLTHYRRYFDFNKKYSGGYFYQNISVEELSEDRLELPKEEELDQIFRTHDIILAPPISYPVSLDIHYAVSHNKEDILELRKIVERLYPDYIDAFDEVMTGNKLSLCNMFVMRKETFNHYSKWLFDILFELEKKGKVWDDPYQARVYGFLSERLLNIYVKRHNMKVRHRPLIMISDGQKLSNIKGRVRNILNDIAFSIVKSTSDCRLIKKLKTK